MSRASSSNVSSETAVTRSASAWRTSGVVVFGSIALILSLESACIKAPEFDEVPKIEFVGLSKDTMSQGLNQEDSITIVFHFEDGDGDIGRMTDSEANNVFLIDSRTGQLDNTFGIPFVPPQGSTNGIEGEVYIKVFSTCCIYPVGDPCLPSTQFPFDEVTYEIYITDRAGHESNRIQTAPITLNCN